MQKLEPSITSSDIIRFAINKMLNNSDMFTIKEINSLDHDYELVFNNSSELFCTIYRKQVINLLISLLASDANKLETQNYLDELVSTTITDKEEN